MGIKKQYYGDREREVFDGEYEKPQGNVQDGVTKERLNHGWWNTEGGRMEKQNPDDDYGWYGWN